MAAAAPACTGTGSHTPRRLNGFTYAADVDGILDLVTGEFSAAIAPSGYTDFDLTVPFTDERCLSLNSEPAPDIGPFSGSGTLYGAVSPDGGAVVNTDWQAGARTSPAVGPGRAR